MDETTDCSRRVRVGDGSLHVREWRDPDGEPLLLIHGIPTHWGLWSDVAARLAGRAHVVAPDMLGHGLSPATDGRPVDIVAQAGYLLEVFDGLGIDRATVVGHDIRGGVAQILAVRQMERVARLGLVNSVCYDSWPIPAMKAARKTAGVVEHLPPALTAEGLKLFLRRGFGIRIGQIAFWTTSWRRSPRMTG